MAAFCYSKTYWRHTREEINMDNTTLKYLHQVHLEMIDEIDRICQKYNICYFLDSGSALGAVRHGGFIPWDDDVDIGMMRDDYEKFLQVASQDMNPIYVIQTHETEPNYHNFHAKIRKKNTLFPQYYTATYKYRGIQVDIFPFDYVPDDPIKALRMVKKVRWLRKLSDSVASNEYPRNIIKKLALYCLKIIPTKYYRKYFEASCVKCNKNKTNFVTSFTYRMSRTKDLIFPVNDIIPVKSVNFEDREYKIMNNPDSYLRIMYGDYMALPPEDQRVTHLIGEIIFDTTD